MEADSLYRKQCRQCWAEVLKRVWGADVSQLRGSMIISWIQEPRVTGRILKDVGLSEQVVEERRPPPELSYEPDPWFQWEDEVPAVEVR